MKNRLFATILSILCFVMAVALVLSVLPRPHVEERPQRPVDRRKAVQVVVDPGPPLFVPMLPIDPFPATFVRHRIVPLRPTINPRAPLGGFPMDNSTELRVEISTVSGNWANPAWNAENEIKNGLMPVYVWRLRPNDLGNYQWCLADTIQVPAQNDQHVIEFPPRELFMGGKDIIVFESTRAYQLNVYAFGSNPWSLDPTGYETWFRPQPRSQTVQRSTGPCS
jgi:hypothetical protein